MSDLVGNAVQLRELRDRLLNGFGIDEIGKAGDGLFLDAIEAAGGAVSLQRSDIAGEAGLGKASGRLVEGEGIPCRGRARRVGLLLSLFVGHYRQHTTGATNDLFRCPHDEPHQFMTRVRIASRSDLTASAHRSHITKLNSEDRGCFSSRQLRGIQYDASEIDHVCALIFISGGIMFATDQQYDIYFKSGLYRRRYPAPNEHTLSVLRTFVDSNSNVLDFGCGTGRYSIPISGSCKSLLSYDISQEAVDSLNAEFAIMPGNGNNSLLATNNTDELVTHGSYDLEMCLFGVLSHITDNTQRTSALRLLHDNLKIGGTLIVSVPNRLRRFYAEQLSNFLNLRATSTISYVREGVPGRLPYVLFTPTTLRSELRQAGFRVVATLCESILPEAMITNSPGLMEFDGKISRLLPAAFGYGILVVATK